MTHRYPTTISIAVPGAQEREISVIVEYERHAGDRETLVDPGNEASVSIYRFLACARTGEIHVPWLDALLGEDQDILHLLMEHWTDEDSAARDRRDEDRAEMIAEDRRERML